MKIKVKLTVLFTTLTATILLLFAVYVHWTASIDRRESFYINLQKEALTKANVLFDARVDAETLQTIYRKNREIISEVEVAIYDTAFNLLYHDAVDIDFVQETREMIDQIISKGEIRFTQDGWQVIGTLFPFEGETYVITAAAYDDYGYGKLMKLRNRLLMAWLAGVVIISFAGWFFAYRALMPVGQMVENVNEITATNLDLRLNEGNQKDELSELAITFNRMLDRLESSFDAQKDFVSNISHELRTPLSAIIAEADLAITSGKSEADYRNALNQIHEDARKLTRLSAGLLDMARASYDPSEISFRPVRVDEVLLDARRQVQQADDQYKVDISFEEGYDDDKQISVNGNEYLLQVAFANLMENGCKFSGDKHCNVSVSFSADELLLSFADKGAGIPEDELDHIFKPFFRGKNHTTAGGYGIGLPLTAKIIQLHSGHIKATSEENRGTTMIVGLRHL